MQLSSRAVDREEAREFFTHAIPDVYGYLLHRTRDRATAEDLTSETMVAAIRSLGQSPTGLPSMPWLIGIARHKLVDHWRRSEREDRRLSAVANDPELSASESDPWDEQLDVLLARDVLASLDPQHRTALTLRYVDDLPVAAVAEELGRTEHGAEALLVRARRAFRDAYEEMQ